MLDLGTPVCILSPLTPEECTRRLQEIATSRQEVSATQTDFVVRGKVSGTSCSFTPIDLRWTRGGPDYRRLTLGISPAPGGTILRGQFATPIFHLVVFVSIAAVVFGKTAQAFTDGSDKKLSFLVVSLFLAFAALVNLAGRGEPEPRLLEFIRSTVHGVIHDSAPKPR